MGTFKDISTETSNLGISLLTLKCLGGQIDRPPCGFSKNVSSKERVKPRFFGINF